MPSYDQNVEAPVAPGQQTTNPQLLNEGYPGISSPQTTFQPPSDGSAMGTNAAPNSQLASLPKDVLLGAITQLPQQDLAAFFQGLPQAEQTQISTFIQQNPNAQGQDLFNQLSQLPTADLAQGLSLLPTADLQQAITAAQQGGGAAGTDASTGTAYGTGTGTDASGGQPVYSPDSSMAPTDTSGLVTQPGVTTDTSGLATQPGMTTDTSGLATQPQMPTDTSGLATQQQMPTDTSGLATQQQMQPAYSPDGYAPQTDTTGLATQQGQNPGMDASGQQQGAGGSTDNSAVLNKLATLNPAELSSVISRLPQQDLSTFFQALPSADQQQLQTALADNQNPTAQDLATAMEKLPARDLLAAAGTVPGNDFASLLSSSTDSQPTNAAPKPGGSEFPLLFGLGSAAALGYVGYRKGLFDKAPDLFQQLTGRFNDKMPSFLSKFGKGGTEVVEEAVPGAAEAGVVAPLGEDSLSVGASIAKDAAGLAKAGSEVGSVAAVVEHAGVAATVLEDGLDVAKVIH